ncbi:MAG: PAS domain S-box protein [Dehalogenimonas sp.]
MADQKDQNLQSSEQSLLQIIKYDPDGKVVINSTGIVLFANPAMAVLMDKPKNEIVGQLFGYPVISGDFSEIDFLHKDGTLGSAEMRVVNITWNKKQARLVSLRDTTERNKTTRSLISSENLYHAVFNTSIDALLLADDDARYVAVNESACRMFGLSREELLKKSLFDITPVPNRELGLQLWHDFIKEGYQSGEYTIVNALGNEIFIDYRAVANVLPGMHMSFLRDVTKRKKAEEFARSKQLELEKAQRLAHIGNWTYDPVSQQPVWSEEMFRIWGLDPKSGAPSYQEHKKLIHSDDWEQFDAAVKASVEYGEPYELELRIIRPDGKERTIITICAPQFDSNGKVISLSGTNQDITERKLAEETLRENEQKFRLLHEAAGVGIGYYSPDGKIISYNRLAASHMNGVPEDFNGKSIWDIFSKAEADFYFERIKLTIKSEKPQEYDDKINLPIGHKWFHSVYTKVLDSKGRVLGIQIVSSDITKRQETELQLQLESKLLDTATDAIFVHTFDGEWVYFNEAACTIHGYTREELSAIKLEQLDAPWARELIAPRIAELMAKGEIIFETAHLAKDGHEIPFEVHARIIESGGKQLVLSVSRDITQRKSFEEELTLKAKLLDSVTDAIFLYQSDGRLVFVNDKAYRTRGYTREEMLSMNLKQLRSADQAEILDSQIQGVLLGDLTIYETAHQTKDGTVFPVEVKSHTVEYQGQQLILSITRNISSRKQVEAEKQQLRDKAEMSSRLAAVGEMAAGIAHEINNPLTGVIGFSELLKDRKDLPEDVVQNLQIINSGSIRVKEIVRRMLTFARQSKPEKSSTSITELIENTLELRSYVLQTANIVVVRNYAPDLPWVKVDSGQMQQVFLNLIVNAEYAMKKAHDKGILTIKTEKLDDYIRISITDDGPGMADKTKAKLFQPFFTTKDPGEGTGLGLSLSFGIIHEHGGTIRAESELGKGTTFIIELPITADTEKEQLSSDTGLPAPTLSKSARILVIDDEPTIRSFVKAILAKGGHTVDETGAPDEVLPKLKQGGYDLVISDIRMPGMGGTELYKHILKEQPEMKDKVLFMTGDTSSQDVKSFLAQNQLPYLTKPFERRTLEEKVNEILKLE